MISPMDRLPNVREFKWEDDGCLFIASVGFEDRASAVLDHVVQVGGHPAATLLIEYKPKNDSNRNADFEDLVQRLPRHLVQHAVYDRTDPETFEQRLPGYLVNLLDGVGRIVVDVSAMSKMLILVLLQGLGDFHGSVKIAYTEALQYGPSQSEVQEVESTGFLADFFVSSGILNIATTSGLSTTAMPGCPQALVAFSGLNQNQLSTLFNELTPQFFYLVDCAAEYEEDKWRMERGRALNKRLFTVGESIQYCGPISTRDYLETVETLERIYLPVRYTHRFVVAPTGSKMQAVGIFIFKCIHPDIQVVYPTPAGYHSAYSRGARAVWSVSFTSFKGHLDSLKAIRYGELEKLRLYFTEQDRTQDSDTSEDSHQRE